jgi:RND family efflux transporter MFP subunit
MGKIKNFIGTIKKLILTHKIITVIVILLLGVLGYFLYPKGQTIIATANVQRKSVEKLVSVTGKITAENYTDLTFQSPEVLAYVGVKLGDSVRKGQLIASLDQNQLQASLRQAQQDFTAAKAASQQYYDNHTNATESDSEKVQRTAIDATQNKAYDQMLKVEHDIANSALYAPIAGIVTRIDAPVAGINITPATTFSITDPGSLNLKLEVDEADIGQVKIGQPIKVYLDAFPNTALNLTVNKIDYVSHTTSSGGNAFYVKALLPQNNDYRIGISGNADITVASKNNVLAISSSSIFNDSYVYVKIADKFEKRKITLGLQSDTESEIVSGLSEGESVAIDPASVPQNLVLTK